MFLRMTLVAMIVMVAVVRLYGPQISQKIVGDPLTDSLEDSYDPLRDTIDTVYGVIDKLRGR